VCPGKPGKPDKLEMFYLAKILVLVLLHLNNILLHSEIDVIEPLILIFFGGESSNM